MTKYPVFIAPARTGYGAQVPDMPGWTRLSFFERTETGPAIDHPKFKPQALTLGKIASEVAAIRQILIDAK
jgi:hypothetical protein